MERWKASNTGINITTDAGAAMGGSGSAVLNGSSFKTNGTLSGGLNNGVTLTQTGGTFEATGHNGMTVHLVTGPMTFAGVTGTVTGESTTGTVGMKT